MGTKYDWAPEGLDSYIADVLDKITAGEGEELKNLEVQTWVPEKGGFHVSLSRHNNKYRTTIAIPVEQVPEVIRQLVLETARFSKAVDTARGR